MIAGLAHSRTDPSPGLEARLGIFGTPIPSIRSLNQDHWIVPPIIKYFGIAHLSECPFNADVVTIIGNPRQLTMACWALIYFTCKGVKGETGPGTCSSSWVAAYLRQISLYFGMPWSLWNDGYRPYRDSSTIPSEQVPTLWQVLELWKERGKKMFAENPPNEEREYIKAQHGGPFIKDDDLKPGYIPWEKRETLYKRWKDKRN